jgi:hypothetical protein
MELDRMTVSDSTASTQTCRGVWLCIPEQPSRSSIDILNPCNPTRFLLPAGST